MAILLDSVLKVVEAQVSEDLHATLDATENLPTYSMHFLTCMHLQEMTMLQERKKEETNNGVLVLSVLHELLVFY